MCYILLYAASFTRCVILGRYLFLSIVHEKSSSMTSQVCCFISSTWETELSLFTRDFVSIKWAISGCSQLCSRLRLGRKASAICHGWIQAFVRVWMDLFLFFLLQASGLNWHRLTPGCDLPPDMGLISQVRILIWLLLLTNHVFRSNQWTFFCFF